MSLNRSVIIDYAEMHYSHHEYPIEQGSREISMFYFLTGEIEHNVDSSQIQQADEASHSR